MTMGVGVETALSSSNVHIFHHTYTAITRGPTRPAIVRRGAIVSEVAQAVKARLVVVPMMMQVVELVGEAVRTKTDELAGYSCLR